MASSFFLSAPSLLCSSPIPFRVSHSVFSAPGKRIYLGTPIACQRKRKRGCVILTDTDTNEWMALNVVTYLEEEIIGNPIAELWRRRAALGLAFFSLGSLGHGHGVITHDIRCTKGLDIWLISLISGSWVRSKHGCFQQFFKIFTLWPLSTDIRVIGYSCISSWHFLIFCWNLSDIQSKFSQFSRFLLISVYCTADTRLISQISWYPVYRFPARSYLLSTGAGSVRLEIISVCKAFGIRL